MKINIYIYIYKVKEQRRRDIWMSISLRSHQRCVLYNETIYNLFSRYRDLRRHLCPMTNAQPCLDRGQAHTFAVLGLPARAVHVPEDGQEPVSSDAVVPLEETLGVSRSHWFGGCGEARGSPFAGEENCRCCNQGDGGVLSRQGLPKGGLIRF